MVREQAVKIGEDRVAVAQFQTILVIEGCLFDLAHNTFQTDPFPSVQLCKERRVLRPFLVDSPDLQMHQLGTLLRLIRYRGRLWLRLLWTRFFWSWRVGNGFLGCHLD